MQFSQKTVLGFFDNSQKSFEIPVYQRAYSWEEKEWKTFLDDIKEQIKGSNNYFYGNLILETIKEDRQYEIIDGQQRLTTLAIFIRSTINVLSERKLNGDLFDIDLHQKEEIYLKNGGTIKIRPVEYDKACYDTIIIDGGDSYEISTLSQKRIIEAKRYFLRELRKETTENIIQMLDKIETTKLTCIEFEGKKDAALMFELQNNRGKELTNMERLKSYLMYQMYVYSSPNEIETNIECISNLFRSIYILISDIKVLDEDSILIYHCNAYIKGFNYRTLEDIKDVFKEAADKVKWIKLFMAELRNSFANIKKMELSNDDFMVDLINLGIPAFAYPFLIKGYKFFGEDIGKLSALFHIMEVVVFRYKLINSRADINSRINEILNGFTGDVDNLKCHFKDKFNETYYWADARVSEYLNGLMFDNSIINYLLWKYEDSIQGKGYTIGNCKIEDEQIEHISPQTPTNGGRIATGYEIQEDGDYDEELKKEYLNCLGNLMLISGSHNASIGNKPFAEKLNSYNSNPLLKQQAQVKEFINNENPIWGRKAIDERHKKLYDFSIKKWCFDAERRCPRIS